MANMKAAALASLLAVGSAGCGAGDQIRFDAAGLDGTSGSGDERVDHVVLMDYVDGGVGQTPTFKTDTSADLAVSERTREHLLGEGVFLTISGNPTADGEFVFGGPISEDDLLRGDLQVDGVDALSVVISTEDSVTGELLACEGFRAQQTSKDGQRLVLEDSSPIAVAEEMGDIYGELAAGGFNFDHVAVFPITGLVGDHFVGRCQVGGEAIETDVFTREGDDDDSGDEPSD